MPDRKRPPGGGLLALGDGLILFLLLAGGLCAVLSAYFISYTAGQVLAVCGVWAAASAALYQWRYGGWTALGLLAAGGALAWRFREEIAAWHAAAQTLSLLGMPPPEVLPPEELLAVSAAAALVLGWVVVRARCWYLAALLVTLPVLPPILQGTLPSWWALLACGTGWGAMLLTALCSRSDRLRLARAELLSTASMAAFLALLTLLLPQEGYTRPQWATDTRTNLIQRANSLLVNGLGWEKGGLEFLPDLGLDFSGLPGGGSAVRELDSGGVNLQSVGPRSYTGQTVLAVETTQPCRNGDQIYLFGRAALDYTGRRWREMDAVLPTHPAASAPDAPVYTMTIRHLLGGSTAFWPYRPCETLPARTAEVYEVDYRPGGPAEGFTPLAGQDAEWEQMLRRSAYADARDVPEAARTALEPLLAQMPDMPAPADLTLLPEEWREAVSAAQRTAAVLHSAAHYSLDVPTMGTETDFVTHFMTQRRGYCVHFATAGALLLRMQGIPARYVSGYLATLDSTGRADIRDSDAHAWVEIYLDGYGWYPVEMTPGYSFAAGASVQPEAAPYGQPEEPDTPDVPDPAEEPDQPDPPEEPEEPEEPEKPDSPSIPDSEEEPDQPEAERFAVDWRWIGRILLAAALLAGIPTALVQLARARRRRRRTTMDTNRSVIAAYRQSLRLTGGQADSLLTDLARKAKFSQHTITEEERTAAWQRLEECWQAWLDRKPRWQRRILSLLHQLI